MKRTQWILLSIFAALATLTGIFYAKNNQKTSLEGYDYNFAVADTTNIGKIFIANRAGGAVTLTREGRNWRVNGKYQARRDAIDNLLSTIGRVALKYRLPRKAVPNVVKSIASSSILVEVFDQKGKKIKSYYVGGVDMDEKGTYMMMTDANEPYATHIPNFTGSLRVRYFVDETDWRDRSVFNIPIDNIKSVSVDYPLQKSKSFKLEKNGRDFNVEPLYPIVPRVENAANRGICEAFLMEFANLGAEGFENEHPQRDSIVATLPFASISIKNTEGVEKTVKFHPMAKRNADGEYVRENQTESALIERYFAETDGELFMVQHVVFKKIFWAYEGFFVKTN